MATRLHALGLPVALAADAAPLSLRVTAAWAGASLCVEKGSDQGALALQLEALFAERRALREEVVVLVLHADPEPLCALLRAEGLAAHAAPGTAGLEGALEQLRPDALIVGERLLAMSGAEVCRALRTSLRHRDLPVVLAVEALTADVQAEAAAAGADDEVALPVSGPALAARLKALVLRARVHRERADTDALTGLFLRRPFLGRLTSRLAESRRRSTPLAVCLLDLDRFKQLNTRLGHFGADRLLAAFARVLQTTFRLEDLCCRWGGDEFAVAFPGQTAEQGLLALRRMEPRARAISLDGAPEPVLFSSGLAAFPQDGTEAGELLRVADERLLHAKAEGRRS